MKMLQFSPYKECLQLTGRAINFEMSCAVLLCRGQFYYIYNLLISIANNFNYDIIKRLHFHALVLSGMFYYI